MNAPVYVDIDQGIHKVKLKNALNEKRKKLCGFSFSINIANFEAFRRTKKLISNLFFLKSARLFRFSKWLYHYKNWKITFSQLKPQINFLRMMEYRFSSPKFLKGYALMTKSLSKEGLLLALFGFLDSQTT